MVESFPASSMGGEEICFNITILDDTIFEDTEYFYLNLELESNVIAHNTTALVNIIDDEGS